MKWEQNKNYIWTSNNKTWRPCSIINKFNSNEVIFIDEIHRLNKNVEEILYPALEDYVLDIIIGKGPTAKSIRINLPPFTLIGLQQKQVLLLLH